MINKLHEIYRHWRVGGVAAVKVFLEKYAHNHLHVISTDPPIVYLWWDESDELLHNSLKDRDLLLLYLFPWSFPKDEIDEVVTTVKKTLERYRRHRIVFLCNEEYSVQLLCDRGLEALFINQNAFIDERAFHPIANIAKTHDAVYSASLAPYKRHALAARVDSLIMLSYAHGETSGEAYAQEAHEQLKHAWWAKDTLDGAVKWSTQQIVETYNRARIGLCLSSVEGGMFASMEYLLCGLSVVSTRSIGGRETFWDERTVLVCEDDADSVAKAVQAMKQRALPPGEVRALTLEKVEQHRERFRELLRPLGVEASLPWPPGSHGITTWYSLRKLARQLLDGAKLDALP